MIAIIGCGNPTRSDDGVGPAIIKTLARGDLARLEIKLLDAGTDGMATMFAARGCKALIVIDACQSGSEPGAIFEVPGAELEQSYTPSLNLHDFRWDHALAAGRKIFRDEFPSDVTVLLVEAQSVSFGLDLSPPVTSAATRVATRVRALIATRIQAATQPG